MPGAVPVPLLPKARGPLLHAGGAAHTPSVEWAGLLLGCWHFVAVRTSRIECCSTPTSTLLHVFLAVLQVKQKFYEAFKGDGYPEAFPYRQRVIILFQKIDGVDVALYCMYVQEYGSDCPAPNRNAVYLSYIDRYVQCWITFALEAEWSVSFDSMHKECFNTLVVQDDVSRFCQLAWLLSPAHIRSFPCG